MRPVAIRKLLLAIRNACMRVPRPVAPSILVIVTAAVIVDRMYHLHAESVALGASISLIALSYSLIAIDREVRVRRAAEAALKKLNDELDDRVEERTTALARVSMRYMATLDTMLAGCQLIGHDFRYIYVNDAVLRHGRRGRDELIGHTMMECYPGIEHTPMFGVLRRCMEERVPSNIENEFAHADGTTSFFELSMQPVPEGVFIVSIDVTERKSAELNAQRQLARLQSLRAIDMSILSSTDLRLTLKTVLDEALARLQASGAYVQLFNADTLMLELVASIGDCEAARTQCFVRVGDGVSGRAGMERRTVVQEGSDTAADGENKVGEPGIATTLCATPLIAKARLIGVLNVSVRGPFVPEPDWIEFLETIAGQAAMAIDSGRLFEELQRTNLDLHLAYDTTIEGWSRALDLRDKETEGHTRRVTELTVRLARLAGMSESDLVDVKRGALLHDIGKMGVPDHILLKPGPLTDDEWVVMRKHPMFARDLLRGIEYLHSALDIPYCHHEKWDGTGYPRGLKGDDIPLAARLFAVVDVWDALRSDRPYRKGWCESDVLAHIRKVAGTHFDPGVVDLFLRMMTDRAHRAKAGAGPESESALVFTDS
jgi:PAS domain S-box-containing protein